MSSAVENYDWTIDDMVEVSLDEPDSFLKIKETLTRIGIASSMTNTLYQSCHILHKRGKYYIVSFLELFILDGKQSTISVSDIERRNAIINLLEEWNLLKVVNRDQIKNRCSTSNFKVIAYKEKSKWNLKPKYKIGVKH